MKRLIIMRHAKSSWADSSAADHERTLNGRGRRSAPVMAQRLIFHQCQPDVMLSSSSQRTIETAELMLAENLMDRKHVHFLDSLYLASTNCIVEAVQDRTEDVVLVLAHNPGVTYFVNKYSNASLDNLPTAGVAVIDFDISSWTELPETKTGKLQWLEFPRMFE